ncbi:MAG: RdgB/HAM1 family non-canonical purine NTP pyrophosphatase [Clostridia bacterium]|nr:RdgB/HAM1 family non-canonical purine NTP pyrophosphatase [Clostridia bacterium]
MKLVFASSNAHKLREVKELLTESLSFDFELLSPKDVGFGGDIVENGETFEENSMIKAKTLFRFCGIPTLADDSGLCVDALGGAPGIHSARYAAAPGEGNSPDLENTALLLKNMRGKEIRSARFVCAVSFASEDLSFCVRAACEGEIIDERRGEGGFGYDPVFFVERFKKTLAEVSEEEKNSISHRGQAVRRAAALINAAFGNDKK